jgi:hypothetical protein
MFKRLSLIVVHSAAGCASTGGDARSGVPATVWTALEHAERYEVLSLDPSPAQALADFHGYRVLARVSVTDAQTRQAVSAALRAGVRPQNSNIVLACMFMPRHAVVAVCDGHEYDLLLCFACHQAGLIGAPVGGGLVVSDDVRPPLEAVLESAAATRATR